MVHQMEPSKVGLKGASKVGQTVGQTGWTKADWMEQKKVDMKAVHSAVY